MSLRRYIAVGGSLSIALVALATFIAPSLFAAPLLSPRNPAPYNGDTSTGDVVDYVVSRTIYNEIPVTKLKIYSESPRIALTVASADMCASRFIVDGAQDFLNPDMSPVSNGDKVSEFDLNGLGSGAESQSKDGNKKSDADCDRYRDVDPFPSAGQSLTDARANLSPLSRLLVARSTKKTVTKERTLYEYSFIARWSADGVCLSFNSSQPNCGVNAFRIEAREVRDNVIGSRNNTWISQNGQASVRDFGMNVGRNTGGFVAYTSYFGTDCSLTVPQRKEIVIYDDDNVNTPGAQPVDRHFLIKLEGASKDPTSPDYNNWQEAPLLQNQAYVSNWGDSPGDFRHERYSDGWYWFGTTESKNTVNIPFWANPDWKYRFKVKDWAYTNVLQFALPFESVWEDNRCLPWTLNPLTDIDKTELVVPNDPTAIWTHSIENISQDPKPAGTSISWQVKQRIDLPNAGGGFTNGPTTPVRAGSISSMIDDSSPVVVNRSSFTARATDNGKRVCQWLEINPATRGTPGWKPSDEKCAVIRTFNVLDQKVIVDAIVSAGGDTETQTSGTLTGRVRVSNFPTLTTATTADGQWGYSEISQKVTATRTTAVKTTEGVGAIQYDTSYACPMFWTPLNPTSAVTCTGPTQTTYSCPSGGTLIGSNCYVNYPASPSYSCPGGGTLSGTRCYKTYPGLTTRAACQNAGHNWSGGSCTDSFNATVTYTCGSGTVNISGTCYGSYQATVVSTYTPTQPATMTQKYNYYCTETRTWTGWTTSTVDWCRDYYTCPGGATAGAGWANSPSEITCESWQCLYGSPPADTRGVMVQTNPPDCEYRCPSTGARAYFDRNRVDMDGSGDRRCFVQPSFTLECRWDTGEVTTDTITGNGDFCLNARTTKGAGNIGSLLCATLTPVRTSGWLPSNPQPGMIYDRTTNSVRQLRTWGWTLNSNQGCNRVVGMPYVKVYGGDVRVGGGVGATSQTCANNNAAAIKTYNNGASEYTGSGTQFAAFSTGFVDRFVSGQFNNLGARPNIGSAPTRLTFANNAGGSGWGGGFGNNAGPCYNYVEKLAANPDDSKVGSTPINGRSLGVGSKFVQYVKGNAYINGSITYNNGARTSSTQIPLYVLVVEGDIFIDDSVTQLDGLYVAIPTSSTAGGNIYTCAFVNGASATLPSTTFLGGADNCKRQLVVNGAFAAKQVKFGRDCGSLRWSAANERTQYFGGTDPQMCGDDNHAAEVFNFTPEVWIRSVSGNGGSTKYDSISSMPPVL